jgi:hypothetical protein
MCAVLCILSILSAVTITITSAGYARRVLLHEVYYSLHLHAIIILEL